MHLITMRNTGGGSKQHNSQRQQKVTGKKKQEGGIQQSIKQNSELATAQKLHYMDNTAQRAFSSSMNSQNLWLTQLDACVTVVSLAPPTLKTLMYMSIQTPWEPHTVITFCSHKVKLLNQTACPEDTSSPWWHERPGWPAWCRSPWYRYSRANRTSAGKLSGRHPLWARAPLDMFAQQQRIKVWWRK